MSLFRETLAIADEGERFRMINSRKNFEQSVYMFYSIISAVAGETEKEALLGEQRRIPKTVAIDPHCSLFSLLSE